MDERAELPSHLQRPVPKTALASVRPRPAAAPLRQMRYGVSTRPKTRRITQNQNRVLRVSDARGRGRVGPCPDELLPQNYVSANRTRFSTRPSVFWWMSSGSAQGASARAVSSGVRRPRADRHRRAAPARSCATIFGAIAECLEIGGVEVVDETAHQREAFGTPRDHIRRPILLIDDVTGRECCATPVRVARAPFGPSPCSPVLDGGAASNGTSRYSQMDGSSPRGRAPAPRTGTATSGTGRSRSMAPSRGRSARAADCGSAATS